MGWKLEAGGWQRVIVAAGCLLLSAGLDAQRATFKAPEPRFADPDRRAEARGAPIRDRSPVQDYAATAHVPGAAWGIIVDGELATPA
jgi:hypothetical protein